MGIAAAVIGSAIIGALGSNIAANKQKTPQLSKSVIKAPSSAVDAKVEEDDINLGSDRAKTSGKRSTGRRKLMADQTSAPASTGLQI
jgi:hypothetical protein